MTDVFYSPAEIIFNREQNIWIIGRVLPSGKWPLEYRETGYTGTQKSFSHSAPFEAVACIISEINQRLEYAPSSYRDKLFEEVQDYYRKEYKDIYYEYLSYESKKVLDYISINKRRVCYYMWLCIKKYRKEKERKELNKPCECGYNRWQTVKTGESWRCRKCLKVRNIENLTKKLDTLSRVC